jgi:hypothetical protein
MSAFTNPLIVKHIDGRNWELIEPFTYHVGEERTTVPQGFITDFASIPRIFWNILAPTGKHGKAAVIHDWLYRTHSCSRKKADNIFYEAMRVIGVSWWKRALMYRAVRWFGVKAYAAGKNHE